MSPSQAPPIDNMAESNRITANMIWAAMPFPKLMRCLGKPTYPKMAIIRKEIYQNLVAILLPFCTGQAGYFGIISSTSMIHFSHPATPVIAQMTFLPMHQLNEEANSSFDTKRQSLSTTPTRQSPNASRTNSRRQSMRTTCIPQHHLPAHH